MPDRIKIHERDQWGAIVREKRFKTCSEAPPLRKYLNAEVQEKGVDPETGMRTFRFIASTGVVDREGDILFPDGWQLDNYLENPVVLWAHESWSFPIGRAVKVNQKKKQLEVDIEFTPNDVNPDGYRVYKLVEAGFVKAVSVGFRPRSWIWNDEHAGYDFSENELLEVSVVPVPANQEALLAAGVDAPTAKWFGGMSKGAAASVVLDTIIKEAINHNRTETPIVGGEPHHETTPQIGYVSCDLSNSGDTTAVTFTDSGGNTWGGTIWTNPDYTKPWYAERAPGEFQLPAEFVWPPPIAKEQDMNKDDVKEVVEEVLLKILPDALKDAISETLAEHTPVEDDPVEPIEADDPVDADADPVADDPVEDPEPVADDPTEDDDILEVDDLTEDGLRGMVGDALREASTAITGKLPD